MQAVNMRENEEVQRKITEEFVESIRRKPFLTGDDFGEVFSFFEKLIDIVCKEAGIEAEYEMKACNFASPDFVSFEYSGKYDKDVIFYFDAVAFCKKYFGKETFKERLNGVAEFLITVYHEVHRAVKAVESTKGYLSPEVLEISEELFLKDALGADFYSDNYDLFSLKKYGDKYAAAAVLRTVTDPDLIEAAENTIKINHINENDFSNIYSGNIYGVNETISELCRNEISKNPSRLYGYPILEKRYNSNGSSKNIHELFDEAANDFTKIIHGFPFSESEAEPIQGKEYFDCRDFYYELIMPNLEEATDRDYRELAEKYGVLALQHLFAGMEKYFNEKTAEKLKYAEKYFGADSKVTEETEKALKRNINSIVRFRNGDSFNRIADTLLRNGGFVRGTREVLREDIQKRRRMFADSLIGVYDASESEEEYSLRAENEKADIDEAVNALYYNRFENFFKNIEIDDEEKDEIGKAKVIRTVQILKTVKILSSETGRDYFGEFLRIPDVNRLLAVFEKDSGGYLKDCMKKSQIRIKKVIYPGTEAEEGKYRDYILGKENTDESSDIRNKIDMLNEEIEEIKFNKKYRNI